MNNTNGATTALGFEAKLWAAADALRNNMDAAEYKHAHGDVHPRNIVVKTDGSVAFIDVLDFRPNADDVYTTAYLPDHYKSLSPSERDRYSLAAVLVELLGSTRAHPTQGEFPIPRVYDELANLLAAETLSTLEPLANVLRDAEQPRVDEDAEFEVTIANLGYTGVPPGEMRSDNGSFHISVDQDRKIADGLRFWVTGIGRQVMRMWMMLTRRRSTRRPTR